MSYVIAAPQLMTAAAGDLATIGCSLDEAHAAAAPTTTAVAPAAADEVSSTIANLFSQHAQDYQALAGKAAAFQEQFVQNLKTSAASYTSIEDFIVSLLRGFETSLQTIYTGVASQIAKFISGSESWINLVPAPLQAFVLGIPFLSIFVLAIPFVLLIAITQAIIAAITGSG